MYTATTHMVTVSVEPAYLARESVPEDNHFVWSYTVTIENNSEQTWQLRTRHWKITDAHGRVQEVNGAGVIGKEPVLKPGGRFEYTSGTPLPTPSGFMSGDYVMQDSAGVSIKVEIPAFSLDTPDQTRRVH